MWNKRQSIATGRTNRGSYRHSFLINQRARDIEFQFFIRETEHEYPPWWTREGFFDWFHDLPENTLWNSYVCCMALLAIVWVTIGFTGVYFEIVDAIYNVTYATHVVAIVYYIICEWESYDMNYLTVCSFIIDIVTFSHYFNVNKQSTLKLGCYYLRLHRPLRYLWALNDYNLKGSVLGTTLKYCYIFMVLRISWALIWLNIEMLDSEVPLVQTPIRRALGLTQQGIWSTRNASDTIAFRFLSALYMINKMFIPIGPSVAPANDQERVLCLLVMISGCVMVSGAAVAALSLVISLYMRPEESFRTRYRLIIKEMKESHIPQNLRDKVESFYKMYWLKQRAVSTTQLLPTYPPTLPAIIHAEIYFEFTQKSRILRDLSYQFLSELAKKMETVYYIPGDSIIQRSSKKSSIIYITYGDIELLTAEDDSTPILRMTRGTLLSPGGCVVTTACGPAHLEIIAATFVTAHVLKAVDLWHVVLKYSNAADHAPFILSTFNAHLEKVKRHYETKKRLVSKNKSSILLFKRNLMALKEAKNSKGESMLARTDLLLDIAGSYLMRNRADASLADEADKICLRPTFPCILQPNSSLQVLWHNFVAALIVTTHPYYLVFMQEVPLEFRFYDFVVTVVYALDLIVHLSTGANVDEGVPITFSQTSSQQCRNHWFVLDVLGTLPIFEFIGNGHFAGINKIFRLPKVFRVLKTMEETYVYRTNVLRFLTYTLLLLMACYLVAALQQSFMCYHFGTCVVANFTHPPFWMKPLGEERPLIDQLTFGLYWSISMVTFTTHKQTHTGTESWDNVQPILYTMFVLEISIVLRIFMEAIYSATIMVTTSLREDYDACIETVKNFLISNQVDPILRQRFINYLQLSWYTDKAYSMTHKNKSIFHDLPPHVYQDILSRQRIKYIQTIPFMRVLKNNEMKMIASKARLFYTSPNEILLNTGDLTNEMYVIKQGICEVLNPEYKVVVDSLTSKHHFGVLNCLLRLPSFYTIRTVTHVQVFSIARKHLLDLLETPQLRDALEYAKDQPEYKHVMVRRQPFLAYQPPEPTPNMERFQLPKKHEPDADFLHPFNRLGFLSILRYIFPRFTIRPDGQYLLRYEWFRATCAVTAAMLFPSYTYLVLQWPWLYYATVLLDMAAWFDIFQRMLIGYFNDKGILVYHPASTAAHYLKGAFTLDLIGCLSLENLEAQRSGSVGQENRFLVTPTKQFLMLNRLLQLYRLQSVLVALPNYIERRDLIFVVQAIPIFMVLVNVLTCFMVFYSVNIYYWYEGDETKWLIIPFQDPGGSWINLFDKAFRFSMTSTPWNLHLAVHFWVVYEVTSTGYNVFNPTNFEQTEVLFVGMACSTMIITYFSVRIISVRAYVNRPLAAFQENMKDIMVYMRRENFNNTLQREVQQYYEYSWDKMGGIDYRRVFKLCDQITLRTDAILHIYGPTFARCPILPTKNVSLLRTLARSVNSEYYLRGMYIIQQDDVISNMYFVDYGGVDVRITQDDMCTVVKLPRGSVFGNLEPKSADRCPMALVAMSRVHLLMINSRAFYNIISDFPAASALVNEYRKENKYYIMGDGTEPHKHQRNISLTDILHRLGLIKSIYFKDSLVQMYLIIICLICIYADVYNAGFQDNSAGLIVGLYVLDVCFYFKLLIHFTMPELVDSSTVRRNFIPTRRDYLKGDFRYDLASILPFELLSFLSQKNRWLVFSWLRLNRTLRIVTVYTCLKSSYERVTVNLILSTVFAVMIWFTLFVHTSSCLWYFMALMQDQAHPNSSWIWKNSGESCCSDSYVCSLYFVITTFTQNGVGDILPKNHSEVVFVSLLQIISTLVFMVYVGEFSNLIQYQYFRSFTFYSKYLELQEFLQNNRVSKNLVALVNRYSLHIWQESRGLQIPHFLKIAPQALKLRIMSAAYIHHLDKHYIFEDCEPAFLRQLVGHLKLYTYNSGMYVVKESEITNAMYLIHTGKVKESAIEVSPTGLSSRAYPSGSYFGVLQGLIRDTPYTHSYETLSKAQVLTLQLQDWEYLLSHFPLSKAALHNNMKYVGEFSPDRWPGGSGQHPRPRAGMSFTDTDPRPPPPPGGAGGRIARDGTEETKKPTKQPKQKDEDDKRSHVTLLSPSTSSKVSGSMLPLDSKNILDAGQTSDEKPASLDASSSMQITGPKYLGDSKSKLDFIEKVKTSAKKFIGKSSTEDNNEPSTLATEAEDDLTLAEDEEATAALLKQYEQKDQSQQPKIEMTEAKSVRVEFKEPGSEENKDKDMEQHMLTVDMKELKYETHYGDEPPVKLGSEPNIKSPIKTKSQFGLDNLAGEEAESEIKLRTEAESRTTISLSSELESQIISLPTRVESKTTIDSPKIKSLHINEIESEIELPSRKTAELSLHTSGRQDVDTVPMDGTPKTKPPTEILKTNETDPEPSSSKNVKQTVSVRYAEGNDVEPKKPPSPPPPPVSLEQEDVESVSDLQLSRELPFSSDAFVGPEFEDEQQGQRRNDEDTEETTATTTTTTTTTQDSSLQSLPKKNQPDKPHKQ